MRQDLCRPLTSLPCMVEESDHHCSGSLYCTVRLRCSGSLRCTVRLRYSGSLRCTVRLRCSGSSIVLSTCILLVCTVSCEGLLYLIKCTSKLLLCCIEGLSCFVDKILCLGNSAPQYGQNFVESGISFPHFSQNIFFLLFYLLFIIRMI